MSDSIDINAFSFDTMQGLGGNEPGSYRYRLAAAIADAAIKAYKLAPEAEGQKKAVITAILENHISLGSTFEKDFRAEWDRAADAGHVPAWVDAYKTHHKELDTRKITPQVRREMIRRLLERGVTLRDTPYQVPGDLQLFEQHLADAYHHALQRTAGAEDPLAAARGGAPVATWGFDVDTFEDLDDQQVVPENIKAAGALFYLYQLCERMGLLKIVDVMVLNWAAGAIDVVDGPGVDALYSYWKFRDDRPSEEERGIVYKRVLNLGETRTLSRMAVNEYFPQLWQQLMEEVARHIKKVETARTTDSYSPVSRKPIQLAAEALRANLSEYATGMAHMQIREIHSVYEEAVKILRDEQVLDHFGGRGRKNMWKVLEAVSKQEYGSAPNIPAIRTMAVDGYHVFEWLQTADVNDEEAFQSFLLSAEAWIIAAGSEEPASADRRNGGFDEEVDEFEDDFPDESGGDEFADFDA